MPPKKKHTDSLLEELRAFGLAYPGAHTKSPWPGHLDLAVNDKTFAYLSAEGAPFGISCKLPHSGAAALMLPFTKPTAYGLGKSGWVSAELPQGQMPPIELFKEWIDESYRAQAPKKLIASLGAKPHGGAPVSAKKSTAAKSAKKRGPARAKRPPRARAAKR
jgi:predicted DNA-binding protein (MmcQ/YjbR family)